MALVVATASVVLGGAGYLLGVFDRPTFVKKDSIVPNNPDQQLYAIVALSRNKNIGKSIMPLLQGTRRGIDAQPEAQNYYRKAASDYGCPDQTDTLSVGVYLDDPQTCDAPRWAIGWAVGTPSFSQAQDMVDSVKKESGLDEDVVIKAVRIGPGPALVGRIPWRTFLTPSLVSATRRDVLILCWWQVLLSVGKLLFGNWYFVLSCSSISFIHSFIHTMSLYTHTLTHTHTHGVIANPYRLAP